jgi:hypothetical protein
VTDFLRINGVPVPVRADQAEYRPELVGESGRGVDGSMWVQRTAIKRTFEVATSPLTAQEALALAGLVHGEGHVWPVSAAQGLYSSRGALLTASGGTVTRSAVAGKFGTDSAVLSNGATLRTAVFYPTGTGREPTLSFWFSTDGVAWTHRVFRAGASQWYTDGVAGAAPSGITPSYSATFGWQLTNSGGANRWLDDLWVCPYDWPATWPAFVFAFNLPVGLCHRVKADGLLIEQNLATGLDFFGEVSSMPLLPGVISTYAANLHTVAFSLMEV